MKLFIKKILGFIVFLLVLLVLTSHLLVKYNTAVYQYLYDYQLTKIKDHKTYSNLFIGDSSLGNAIDSEEFSRLSSQETINCAMTGLYGYAGSYNMLKTTHKYHPELKNVILMQSLFMQTSDVAMDGYVRTVNSVSDFNELEFEDQTQFVKEYLSYVKSIPVRLPEKKQNLIYNDYIKQTKRYEPEEHQNPFDENKINPEKNKFLIKITDYCSKHNLNLIYAHGPIYQKKLEVSKSYVASVNSHIEKTGINLISTPVAIKKDHLGDNVDHINPLYKKDYTSIYYELIKQHLTQ